jgi:hypothetical protein
MVDVAEGELEELVRQDRSGVCESKERMIGENGPKAHGSCMQYCFMAEATKTSMTMNYFNPLPKYDVPKYWEEGEDRWHRRLSVDDEKRYMVDLEAIGEVVHSCTAFVGMSDYDDLVAAVDELRGELVDVAFNSSGLRKEEVTYHGDVVRHVGNEGKSLPSRAADL